MSKNYTYDSREDTLKHIKKVQNYLLFARYMLAKKAENHDLSKLKYPEKEIFDLYTPKLKDVTYGSDEYKKYLKEMKIGLDHHYKENKHHPEYFKNSVEDMNLFDIMEMFFDWLAATKRHKDGNMIRSIKYNKERFKYDNLLEIILKNTNEKLESYGFNCVEKYFSELNEESINILFEWMIFGKISDNTEDNNKKEDIKKARDVIMELISNGYG